MAQDTTPFLAARTDSRDWLLEAEGPLAALQLDAGGQLPGIIAAPALLELVRKARIFGLRLSRRVEARSHGERISAWVEVLPEGAGQGCSLRVSDWRSTPLAHDADARDQRLEAAIARDIAELTVRLGPAQQVLAAAGHAPDTAETVQRMNEGAGRHWTDFVVLEGEGDARAMHWRLLDGATLRLPGSARLWTAHLHPLGRPDAGSAGFELALAASEPAMSPAEPCEDMAEASGAGLGRELAPVLRQPVARIIANAETIRTQLAGPLAQEYANYAADIASAGEHLLSLIDDLTDLEMVEDANFATIRDRIDLADVARRAAGLLAMRAQQKSIAVEAPAPDLAIPAIGEFKRALQIVLNLLGNAIRYSQPGAPVRLRAGQAGGRAWITVADQGEGIGKEAQQRMFDKFERLGRSGDGGSGLGLYISRRLARAMDGELSVESAPGEGARFTLELPGDPEGGA